MIETDYSKVPVEYMADGVRRYIEDGVPPGGFLSALFSNDLKLSFGRADDNNIAAMRQWVNFVYWEMPRESQGSPALVKAWIDRGGLNGIIAAAQEEVRNGR